MKIDIYSTPELLVIHSKEIEAALRKAVRQAIMEHKQAGQAIAIWKNGKIEVIEPEEIELEPAYPPEQTDASSPP